MWDVFISHATEDKEVVARPLAEALRKQGLKVWYDEFTLTVGDSLRRRIDEGLAKSTFGIVILSPAFLSKEWPQTELDGLAARQSLGKKVILPVWHNVTKEEVLQYSPILADRLAAQTSKGIVSVLNELLAVLKPEHKPLSEERIEDVLKSYLPLRGLFVAPNIPPDKLGKSRKACRVPEDDAIVGLIDSAFLGLAKNYSVFGLQGFYFNSNIPPVGAGTIPYSDFPNRNFHIDETLGTRISLGKGLYIHSLKIMPSRIVWMLNDIKALIKRRSGLE